MVPETEAQLLRRGIHQFNSRDFFEAHETWEKIWLTSSSSKRILLQGLIQLAAAFHHYHRGNLVGTRTMLEAALTKLSDFPRVHSGLQLESLRVDTRKWLTALNAGKAPEEATLPQIEEAE